MEDTADAEKQNAQCLNHFKEALNQMIPTKTLTLAYLYVQVICEDGCNNDG